MLYKDAEGDQQMMNIFAALLLGAAAFAAFNLVSRTVEAQRREIGIGMALGVATARARAATAAARRARWRFWGSRSGSRPDSPRTRGCAR